MNKVLLLLCIAGTPILLRAQTPQLAAKCGPAAYGSTPSMLTGYNGKLYFYADDSAHGRELWSYTEGGTASMICDQMAGAQSGIPTTASSNMGVLNNKLYLPGYTSGATKEELYVYDGVNPLAMVADLNPGLGGSGPKEFVTFSNILYFNAGITNIGSELFSYDGINPPVIHELRTGSGSTDPQFITPFKGKLYFSGTTPSNGKELCVYDPLTGNIAMANDIEAGTLSSNPEYLQVVNGKLYFTASTQSYGRELYSYDGITATRLTDLVANSGDGVANMQMAAVGNVLFFSSISGATTTRLFKYDIARGTASMVYNVRPAGVPPYTAGLFMAYSGKLYFTATDTATSGNELWVTDGTNTHIVADLNPGKENSSVRNGYIFNSHLYFSATNGATGQELYRINDPTGIQKLSWSGALRVYPNPAAMNAYMELTLPDRQTLSIQVSDVAGRRIWSSEATNYSAGRTSITLPLQQFPAGSYWYRIADAGGEQLAVGQLIKQ